MTEETKLKVLSLNVYSMGHVTYQHVLEKNFGDRSSPINFISLRLPDYIQKDYPGKVLYWLMSKRIFGSRKADYDFYRFRTELACSFFARRCLSQAIKTYHSDVLHIHTQGIAYLLVPLFRKIPSVVSIDYTTALLAIEHPFPAKITYKPIINIERKCFESAAHIITFSERARNSVIEDYKILPKKVTVIPPGTSIDFFHSKVSNKLSDSEKVRLLFVGNDFVRKGGEDLVAVFKEYFSDTCELDLVTNEILKLPVLPNFRIHRGIRPLSPEILNLYQMADIFVMPTQEDCFPNVFIEAMAAGLPCIGTTVMGVPELVQNGHNGFTIPPGDRQSLRQAIRTLVSNPGLRISMGLASKSLAQNKFNAFLNCKRMADIFLSVSKSNFA